MGTEATLLDALRAVEGVAAADIEPDDRPDGAGTLRLQLAPGADEIVVATSVNRVLREQFGLAVDANRVQVVEESAPFERPPPPALAEQEPERAPVEADLAPGETAHDETSQDAVGGDPAAAAVLERPTLTAVPGYRDQDVGELPEATDEPDVLDKAAPDADGGDEIEMVPARGPRILIQRMQLVSAGLGVTTQVTLSWQQQTFPGEASAAATPSSVHRSVAQATLRAVEGIVDRQARFELEQLELNQLGPDRAVVVVISMLTRVGSEKLTGVSVIREDVRQAVIRATLDALNRRIESMLLSA